MTILRTNSPCNTILLWTSFYFLQVNQQKGVGMISTYNIYRAYSEQKPSTNLSRNHQLLDLSVPRSLALLYGPGPSCYADVNSISAKLKQVN